MPRRLTKQRAPPKLRESISLSGGAANRHSIGPGPDGEPTGNLPPPIFESVEAAMAPTEEERKMVENSRGDSPPPLEAFGGSKEPPIEANAGGEWMQI